MAAIFIRTYLFILLFIFFFVDNAFSQLDLSGRVEDETTQRPIPNASVYFNGTTIATHTDDKGNFVFNNLRLINTEIVIFSPGYELLIFKPTEKNVQGKKVVFRLQHKEAIGEKLQTEPESRKQALIAFKENLLGVTLEASESKILNEDALYFLPGNTETEYQIMCDTPLIIVNRRLGYIINYNLIEYSVNIIAREQQLFGFVWYKDMNDAKTYSDRRKKVYEASTLHFFRSLVNHQLNQEQFETYWMMPVKDPSVLESPPSNLFVTYRDTALLEPAMPYDLLFIDSNNNFTIRMPNKLFVYFGKNPWGKTYLLSNGFREGIAINNGVQSYLRFNAPSIGINYQGVLDDYSSVEYGGYWQYELLANKLPLDYDDDN